MRVPALGFLLVLFAAGCGGSSSETPPPLEPDPTSARYTGPRFPSREEEARSVAEPEPEAGLENGAPLPKRPARATWGSGKAAPSTSSATPRPSSSAPVN